MAINPVFQQLEGIIKYILPGYVSQMSTPFGFSISTPSSKGHVSQYWVRCLDESEIEYFTDQKFFSTTDCQKGNQRNKVRSELKNLSSQERLDFFNYMEKKFGFTDTNLGKVILVNKQGVKTQIII